MVLYDVILAGFPEGPKIGTSEAEALSTVFGIPKEVAERMVAKVPAVVKSGVAEDVCRKYYNAFAYIGAKCEFLVTEGTAGERAPGQADPEEIARPVTVSEDTPASMRPAPTAPVEMPAPAPDTGTLAEQVRTSHDRGSVSRSTSGPNRPVSTSTSAPRDAEFASHRAEEAGGRAPSKRSHAPVGNGTHRQLGASALLGERKMAPESATERSLPNRHLRAMFRDNPDSIDVAIRDGGNKVRPLVPEAAPRLERPLSGNLSIEMTPPESRDWSPMDLPGPRPESELREHSEPSSDPAPPKANILDANPTIGGLQPDLEDSINDDDQLDLDSSMWPSDPEIVPSEFLRNAEQTGGDPIAGTRIPRENTADVTIDPVGPGAAPSVAEIKAAWKAGKDISLGPSLPERDDPPSLGDWDPWIDSVLPDADFPSGMPGNDSQNSSSVDLDQGTQLEVPATALLMAQLEAQKRALPQPDDVDPDPEPVAETPSAAEVSPQNADSNAPLFGAPLGARVASESATVSQMIEVVRDEHLRAQRPPGAHNEPTEVPMAAMNFVRLRKKD